MLERGRADRALGLAGYFTEAHFDDSKSALVLDDPVTSLDHVRRAARRAPARSVRDRPAGDRVHARRGLRRRSSARRPTRSRSASPSAASSGAATTCPGCCTDQHPWKAKDVPRRLQELEQQLAPHQARPRRLGPGRRTRRSAPTGRGKLSETWERLDQPRDRLHGRRPRHLGGPARRCSSCSRASPTRTTASSSRATDACSAWARRHDKSPGDQLRRSRARPNSSRRLQFVRAWFDRVKKYRN
ncbi:MAG: hypothetical protein WKF31_04180 [Thermoleophilaceae bacterium]